MSNISEDGFDTWCDRVGKAILNGPTEQIFEVWPFHRNDLIEQYRIVFWNKDQDYDEIGTVTVVNPGTVLSWARRKDVFDDSDSHHRYLGQYIQR